MFRGRRGRVKTGSRVSAARFIVSHKREQKRLLREMRAGCFPRVIAVVRDCNLVLRSYAQIQYANVISLHHQRRGTVEIDAVSRGSRENRCQPIGTGGSHATSNEMFF